MGRLTYILLLLCITSCAPVHMRTANEYFFDGSYSAAAFEYEAAMRNRLNNKGVWRLAECYRLSGDVIRAEDWYRKAVDFGYGPDDRKVVLADLCIRNGRFEQARVLLEDRLRTHPEDPEARRLISVYRNRETYFRDTASWSLERIPIDLPATDLYSPVLMRGGLLVVSDVATDGSTASRRCTKQGCCADLFYIRETPLGHWFEPEPLRGAVNGFLNEGPACFNASGDTLYFTRNRYQSNLEQRGKGGKSLLRIYSAAFIEGEWVLIGELPLADGTYSAAHPALSPDGTRLVFSSDQMSRGGDFDLLISMRLMDGSWSAPRFMDGGVNTQGNEGFPVFSSDGTFHFASDGLPGLGGLDIYRADLFDDSSAHCSNAGAPFNSGGDDFGLVYDSTSTTAYFSSSRGGIRDRLYKVVRKKPDPVFNFRVLSAQNPLPLCTLQLKVQGADSMLLSDQNGSASVRLPKGANAELMVSCPGYLTQRLIIRVPASPDSSILFREIDLLPVPYLDPVVWPGIDFLKKLGEFIPDAYPALDSLAQFLQDNPGIVIEITAFTDARNKEAENRTLTELRCQRIARYLVAKGISPAQFRLRAAGESGIRNRCRNGVHCAEQEHALNNRIQISIERFPLQSEGQ